MKKLVKLDVMLDAYKELAKAEDKLEFARKYWQKFPDRIEEAEAKRDKAKADFDDVAAPIADIVREAEGRASARTITALTIAKEIVRVEQKLGIGKTALYGVEIEVDPNAQHFPHAYTARNVPMSTHFHATYKNGWRLDWVSRSRCYSSSTVVTLTDAAKAAIIKAHEQF